MAHSRPFPVNCSNVYSKHSLFQGCISKSNVSVGIQHHCVNRNWIRVCSHTIFQLSTVLQSSRMPFLSLTEHIWLLSTGHEARVSSSLHLHPTLAISASTTLHQGFFSLPPFPIVPIACLIMCSIGFLRVWPIQLVWLFSSIYIVFITMNSLGNVPGYWTICL